MASETDRNGRRGMSRSQHPHPPPNPPLDDAARGCRCDLSRSLEKRGAMKSCYLEKVAIVTVDGGT